MAQTETHPIICLILAILVQMLKNEGYGETITVN